MAIRYQAGGGNFEILPEGTFDCEIKKVDTGTNNNGNEQLVVDFEVADGPLAGRKHKEWIVLTVGWRIDRLRKAAGVDEIDTGEKDPQGKPIMSFDEQDLVGKFVQLEIVHREYPPNSGKVRANSNNEKPSPLNVTAAAGAPATPASTAKVTPATQPADGGAPGAGAVAPRRPRPSAG